MISIRTTAVGFSLLSAFALVSCGPSDNASDTNSTAPASPTPAATTPTAARTTVRSQTDLASAFNASTETIFEARTSTDLMAVKAQQQANLSEGPTGLKLTATGSDPKLRLPPFIEGKQALLEVTIVSPVRTPIQLFYSLRDQPGLSEERSQTLTLKPGKNVVYFQLDQEKLTDPLWLDPAAAPGEYVIESIIAKAIPKSATP